MLDRDAVAARVAELVGIPAPDDAVTSAVLAAEVMVVHAETVPASTDPAVSALPDDALTFEGMVGLSRRLFLDATVTDGSSAVLGDLVADVVYAPEDPYRHYRHFFAPLAAGWGVA